MSDLTTIDTDLVDGYPTEALLEAIPFWTGTPRELVEDVLAPIFAAYGGVNVTQGLDDFDRPVQRLRLVTGGWSGNESAIGALEGSFFWAAWWDSSERGGAYTFEIPDADYDKPMIDWSKIVELNRRLRDWRAHARDHIARTLVNPLPRGWAETRVEVSNGRGHDVAYVKVSLFDAAGELIGGDIATEVDALNIFAELVEG